MSDARGGGTTVSQGRVGHRVHASLVRSVLYLGVERPVIAFEATLCLAMLFGVGLHLVTAGLIGAVMLVIHPSMLWLTARDAQATEVYIRSRRYADYYAPHGTTHARGRPPRPSIPGVR